MISGDASGPAASFASPADGEIGGGFAEGNHLSGIENIIGSSHDDVLIGHALANVLDGGAGNDVLRGEGWRRYPPRREGTTPWTAERATTR